MHHHVDVPLRWSDMDAYGHVNNVHYLLYLEEARIAAFAEWFPQDDPVAAGVVVARSEIEYASSLEHRAAPVRVEMWCSSIGGSSFVLDYLLRDPDGYGDAVYARATSTHVMLTLATGQTRPISDYQRERLEHFGGEPVELRSRG